MKILKSAHICRATCTVCKCTSKVLKLHNFNAWRRSRWWKTRRRTEVNESRAALLSNLNVFQCTKLAGVYCFLYDLKMILYYWQGFYFYSRYAWCVLSAFQTAHRPSSHVCFCFITRMQKSGGLRQKKSMSISWMCERKSFGLHEATVDTIQCFYNVINGKRQQITDWR